MHEVVLNEIARCIFCSENWWIMSLIFYPAETNNIENSRAKNDFTDLLLSYLNQGLLTTIVGTLYLVIFWKHKLVQDLIERVRVCVCVGGGVTRLLTL